MNIKSLLLGSAAALLAVSGARAADAVEVVAEPEPVEYVRVCDTYGAKFYYIPGTETCLRVGGYVRYDIGAGIFGHQDVLDKKDWAVDGTFKTNDTYYKRARASIILDARSETELGTLRSYIQFHVQNTSSASYSNYYDVDGNLLGSAGVVGVSQGVDLNHAYIELGGFRVGHTDSIFDTFTNSAGNVINDDIVNYAPSSRTNQIGYNFNAGNGFIASVALEAPTSSSTYTLDSYVPNVAAGIGYTGGWGGVTVVGGYDSVWEEFAVKARLDANINETISAFVMGGWQSDADRPNFYAQWEGDWAVWGGLSAKVSEKAKVNLQLSYDQGENFAAVANVNYEIVPNFIITPEIAYYDNFDNNVDVKDNFGAFLRFQRNF